MKNLMMTAECPRAIRLTHAKYAPYKTIAGISLAREMDGTTKKGYFKWNINYPLESFSSLWRDKGKQFELSLSIRITEANQLEAKLSGNQEVP